MTTVLSGLAPDRLFYYKWEIAEAVGLRTVKTLKKEVAPLIASKTIQWDTPGTPEGKVSQRKMLTRKDALAIIRFLEGA